MNHVVRAALWLYASLVRLYPRALREAFGDELLAVFALKLRAAQDRGPLAVVGVLWAELRDLPGIVVRASWLPEGGRSSWQPRAATWAAMAPFLLSALLQAGNGLTRIVPALALPLQLWLGWLVLAVWALVLLVGVARGLPRWSLPTGGMALGTIGFIINGSGTFGGIRLHWRITYPSWVHWYGQYLLPSIAVLALLLGLCMALPWLRPLARRWRDDWTQLSFLLYGFTLIALEMLDMHPSEMPLTIAGLLILAGGAWAYMRAGTTAGRLLALGGAATLMMAVAGLGQALLSTPEWHRRFPLWRNLGDALVGWLWLLGALLTPALLALLPRRATPTAPATGGSLPEVGSPTAPGGWAREDDSWRTAVAGTLPFLAFGLASLERYGLLPLVPSAPPFGLIVPAVYGLLLLGLLVGWARGFPRWAYAYLGLPFVSALAWMGLPIGGLGGNALLGWRAWLPLAAVVALMLLAPHAPHRLTCLATGIWKDWSRLTFALYGCLPLAMFALVDEIDGRSQGLLLLTTTLALAAGAWAYLHSATPARGAGALAAGLLAAATLISVGNSVYWGGRFEPWMRDGPPTWYEVAAQGLALTMLAVVLMLAPALLAVIRHWVRSQRRSAPPQTT
ncbi:MAG: hypothetical protein HGA45_27980 [Chloroflexales bacterium]|nr:hypothetical protein [Chloroflexales bacterium]